MHNCSSALLCTRALHSLLECREKRSQEFFRKAFLFFCARKGQAYLKTLEVWKLLRFLNVLDQRGEMKKNYFDFVQIFRVIILLRLNYNSVGENNLSTEDEFTSVHISLTLVCLVAILIATSVGMQNINFICTLNILVKIMCCWTEFKLVLSLLI